MFAAALFSIAKTGRQHKCSPVDTWIKKMSYIYIMEYYSATRKEDILPFATTWVDREHAMLR